MAQLIAFIDNEKPKQNHVLKIINEQWDNIFLLINSEIEFDVPTNCTAIRFDGKLPTKDLKEFFYSSFSNKLTFDVGINLICGSGKEHMALITALLQTGVGIRYVIATSQGMEEL